MSAIRIDEEVPHVYLVLFQVESGDSLVIVHEKGHMHIVCHESDMIPEFPSVAFESRCGELKFGDNPEVLACCVAGDPEGYLQVGFMDECCGCDLKIHDGEVRQGLRCRDTFVAYAGQSVICRHEQIVTADVAAAVERWSFGFYCTRKGVPLYLFIVTEVFPFLYSSMVD